jgi:N utilization substance protein A
LLTDAIVREEAVESAAADLMSVDGMDEDTAALLTSKGIQNAEDLADLAVDELVELTAMDEERAKALIMTARAPMLAGA